MASLTYFIKTTKAKKPKEDNGNDSEKTVQILCRFRTTGVDQLAGSNIYIYLDHWEPQKERVKPKYSPTYTEPVNKKLDDLRSHILHTFEENRNSIEAGWLVNTIKKYYNPDIDKPKEITLFSFIRDFIDKSVTRDTPKTQRPVGYKMRREYERTFFYLQSFARMKKRKINFEDITLDFHHDFVEYLQSTKTIKNKKGETVKEEGLAKNTIGKKIQTLKIFLNAATDMNVNKNMQFKSHRFTATTEESDHIYLTFDDLKKIENLELSSEQERIRDLFLIGCWTGLRFSDWNKITDSIKDNRIHIKQEKTRHKVAIPVLPVVRSIIDKYGGQLPEVPTNQHMNRTLKDIAKLAELNEYFTVTMTKAGIERTTRYEKWQLVSTHTARRSFATNMYHINIPSITIMAVTGHKTETSFLKYIKVTSDEHSDKMMEMWSRNEMKVATA